MTPEDRLRQAINARTSRIEPSDDSLPAIKEKLVETQARTNRNRLLVSAAAAVAVLAGVAGALALNDDDQPVRTSGGTTTTVATTTTDSTTTTTAPTTTTTTAAPTVDPAIPVWPRAASSQRFEDPVSAARSFMVDLVGMVDPVMGQLQQGDSRSGEVPVQPIANGPVTTVLVRQLEDDTWYVLGAATDDVRLDTPQALADIECPVRLTGEALAFEGTVQVAVRDDLSTAPIGTGTVMGGGGPSAPFDGTVSCDLTGLSGAQHGSIALTLEGGPDGTVWAATVIRVALQ